MKPLFQVNESIFRNKVLLMLAVLIFGSLTQLFGQEENNNKHQIGVNIYSFKQDNNKPNSEFYTNFLTGITYKHNYSNFTMRYSLNYNNYFEEIEWSGPDSYGGNYDYSKLILAIGLQKSVSYKKLSLFYGLDLFGGLGISDSNIGGGLDGEGFQGVHYDLWFGTSPVLSIQYSILPQLSISIESSIDFAFVYGYYDLHGVALNFEPLLNPVNAISINYNF